MRIRLTKRAAAVAGTGVAVSMLLAACGADAIEDQSAGGDASAGGGDAAAGDLPEIDCAPYEEFGDLSGTSVSWYTPVRAPDDADYITWVGLFEECTGVTVNYEGSAEFEAQLLVRIQSGQAPDVAMLPQPGLAASIITDNPGLAVEPPEAAVANFREYYNQAWEQYGTVDGTLYGLPNSSNAKSLVWYSPTAFEENGYEVPETWDEMVALSDQIVEDFADNEAVKPWCAGIGSGDATGWVATDWMEDVMLRMHGPEVYDQWVNHEIPFNDPQVASVLEEVGRFLKNPDYVNGGIGGVQSIATTEFQAGGLPITEGQCFMHRQAAFYSTNFPEGTSVAEDGDIWAFYLPPMNEEFGRPLLGGGEVNVAFADRPEVQAFQVFLTQPDATQARGGIGGGNYIPPNTEFDPSVLPDPVQQLSAELLTDPEATFRFDASDLMPGAVGAGSFWSEMTAWIAEDKSNEAVLDAIEQSWP
ncbi:ABC transporter substrate-binding protein [Aquipuribacter nitratireducens]|uniref:ABC transporter substrate-binding protein n=1 Tax=Aquipuribacter nitratireducens TaxID=650104 RepID=A0ABW0GMD2_9MICO